jgi:hypothetical protein
MTKKAFRQRESFNGDPAGNGNWSYEQSIPGLSEDGEGNGGGLDKSSLDISGFRDLEKEAGSTLMEQGYTVVSGADKPSKKDNGGNDD